MYSLHPEDRKISYKKNYVKLRHIIKQMENSISWFDNMIEYHHSKIEELLSDEEKSEKISKLREKEVISSENLRNKNKKIISFY